MTAESLTRNQIIQRLEIQEEIQRRLKDEILDITPNAKQAEFLNCKIHETIFSGGNQLGKSHALRLKIAMHATGLYHKNYKGHRFPHPIQGAIGGETSQTTRDHLVNGLLGGLENRGSGVIPSMCFDDVTKDIIPLTGGVRGQVDYFNCKHHTDGDFDGWSKFYVFTYQARWKRIQGYTLHYLGIDEEPGREVYDELSARTNKTGGFLDISLSPLQGWTWLYKYFYECNNGMRCVIPYGINDASHLTSEEYERLCKKYAGHYMEQTRLHGLPSVGEGLIFNHQESVYVLPEDEVPQRTWLKVIGLDFPHTTGFLGATKIGYNPESDTIHVLACYKGEDRASAVHASAIRGMGGERIPCAWPHDNIRPADGIPIADKYRDHNLNLLPEAAHFLASDGKRNRSLVAAIEEVNDRLGDGRLVINPSCHEIIKEMREYRSKDGRPVRNQDDHCLDALFKAIMMLRYAESDEESKSNLAMTIGGSNSFVDDFDFFGVP